MGITASEWESKIWVLHLNENRKYWDINAFQWNFTKEDVQYARAILVLLVERENKLIWHFTRYGNYAVNSEYSVARELLTDYHNTQIFKPKTLF